MAQDRVADQPQSQPDLAKGSTGSALASSPRARALLPAQVRGGLAPTRGPRQSLYPAQAENAPCSTCGTTPAHNGEGSEPPNFIYALGRVEPRFPSMGVERELAQATGRAESVGLTDRQALFNVLSQPANRYLARQLCYVLTIEGVDTYILYTTDPGDRELLVNAIRPAPSPGDVDIVIGIRGPMAQPDMCNGLQVPVVLFEQMYSFDRDTILQAVPRPDSIRDDPAFRSAAAEVFDRILQLADNAGATDEHRALNYLAARYPAIYAVAAEAHQRNFSLSDVEVRPSRLSGVRKIVDAIFSYTNRQTDVTEQYFVRLDVTEMFPFLVTRMQPFFER